jgi:hypothetical protein
MHRHNWNMIDKTILEAPFSKALRHGVDRPFRSQTAHGAEVFTRDTLVLTFKCDCGGIKVESRR